MDDVGCTGSEATLFSCTHTTSHSCTHAEDAGVQCVQREYRTFRFWLAKCEVLTVAVMLQDALMAQWDYLVAHPPWKGEWKYVSMDCGVQCAVTHGPQWMQMWHVDNSGILALVGVIKMLQFYQTVHDSVLFLCVRAIRCHCIFQCKLWSRNCSYTSWWCGLHCNSAQTSWLLLW